jgi:type IV secretion system protein TrbL
MMLQVSPPTQFLQAFEQVRGQWFATALPIATNLFAGLALIEFAWSAAELMLERTTLESWIAGLIKKVMWIGAFYALLLFGPTWIPAIINSFMQIGQQASGVGPLQPGAVFGRGLDLAGALLNGASQAGFLSSLSTGLAMVIAAISTFLCFVLISIQLVAALVESYIVVAAAFIFLGFGGSRWTAPYVEKYIALAVGVGVKIMILYLLIGVGMTLSASWVTSAQQIASNPQPIMNALDILGESLIFIALCWFVPKIVAGVLGGSPAFTGGEIIAVAGTAAYAAVQAGRIAVGFASSGVGGNAGGAGAGAAAGAGSTGGGAGTMAAPGGSSGGGSQPGPPLVAASVGSNGGSNGAGNQVPPPSTNGAGGKA